MTEHGNPLQGVLTRCWDDTGSEEPLIADPAATLAAEGVEIPEGVTVCVVADSLTERTLVIPCAPARGLTDEELTPVVGRGDEWCDLPCSIEYPDENRDPHTGGRDAEDCAGAPGPRLARPVVAVTVCSSVPGSNTRSLPSGTLLADNLS